MPTEEERLLVRIEATQRKFERQMQAIYRSADRTTNSIERGWSNANRRIERGFARIDAAASRSFRNVSRFSLAAAGALVTREVTRYADAWTRVENQIRAAEQISGTQARSVSRLNDLANRSRSGLETTANLYARLLRVSQNVALSEEQVAQATETVARAFKAGGAAASEQAAGVLQLSQALSSGFLQGDELRSLRENAPLLAQAIADEFETTIGGLKQLGADGELTSERVAQAILNATDKINAAFAVTEPTLSEGFTALRNGMIELVGAFDDGARASSRTGGALADLGEYLAGNVEAAERFGAQVSEAFAIIGEVVDGAKTAIEGLGGPFDGAGEDAIDVTEIIVAAFQTIITEAAGVAAFLEQAFLRAVDAVGSGAVGIANAAISAVEGILNKIIEGVQNLVSGINSLITSANRLPGLNLPTLDAPLRRELGRVSYGGISDGASPVDAYRDAKESAENFLDGVADTLRGYSNRLDRAGEQPGDPNDPRGVFQIPPATVNRPGATVAASPDTAAASSGRGGGRSTRERTSALADLVNVMRQERAEIEQQIALVGKSAAETAALETRTALLNRAKEEGINLDQRIAGGNETVREQIDRHAEAIGLLTQAYEEAQERADFIRSLEDSLLDSIVAADSFADAMSKVAQMIARAAFEAALFGRGPFSGFFGGSGSGLIGSLFPGRATGGPVSAGQPYMVGEQGRELFIPNTSGQILSAPDTKAMMRAPGASPNVSVAAPQVHVRNIVVEDATRIGEAIYSAPRFESEVMAVVERNRR